MAESNTTEDPSVEPELELDDEPEKPPRGKGSHKARADHTSARDVKILEMRAKDLALAEIAKANNCSVASVQRVLKKFSKVFKELENIDDYRMVKSRLLQAGQLAGLKSALSPAKLAKAGFLSTVQGVQILNNMERLENNQTTANVGHVHQHFGEVTLTSGNRGN